MVREFVCLVVLLESVLGDENSQIDDTQSVVGPGGRSRRE